MDMGMVGAGEGLLMQDGEIKSTVLWSRYDTKTKQYVSRGILTTLLCTKNSIPVLQGG